MSSERNVKLILSYDGTHLQGWQRQKRDRTVQGDVEDALCRMTASKVNLFGAGRTDAGVHALAMPANFKTTSSIPLAGFQKGLNSLLSGDIRVMDASEAPPSFHSRKDAVAKAYEYRFSLAPILSALDRLYWTHFSKGPFFREAVDAALSQLVGEHDFSSFEAAGSRTLDRMGRGAVRKIFSARLFQLDGEQQKYYFHFVGDGFLRHMVRNIVGTIMQIGFGKWHVNDMSRIVEARDRQAAGPTAPAHGLMLRQVYYSPYPHDNS